MINKKEVLYPYMITEDGRVYNDKTGRYLKPQHNKKGYLVVRVTVNKIKHTIRIHREVAKAFIENPLNKPQVNHIDGNKENNKVENLEWVTGQENVNHAMKNGLWERNLEVARISNEKRKKKIIAKNKKTGQIKYYESVSSAEREYGRHVCDVLKGKREHTKGWSFFYA